MQNTLPREITEFELLKTIYLCFNELKLSPVCSLVIYALCWHYPRIYPSLSTMARNLNISRRSVIRSIKILNELGLISYTTKRNNNYQFTEKFFKIVTEHYRQIFTSDNLSGDNLAYDNLSFGYRQNDGTDMTPCHQNSDTMAHKQINNKEINKKNNKGNILNFSSSACAPNSSASSNSVQGEFSMHCEVIQGDFGAVYDKEGIQKEEPPSQGTCMRSENKADNTPPITDEDRISAQQFAAKRAELSKQVQESKLKEISKNKQPFRPDDANTSEDTSG